MILMVVIDDFEEYEVFVDFESDDNHMMIVLVAICNYILSLFYW